MLFNIVDTSYLPPMDENVAVDCRVGVCGIFDRALLSVSFDNTKIVGPERSSCIGERV